MPWAKRTVAAPAPGTRAASDRECCYWVRNLNYFGHAAMAARRGEGAEFVLGSMLPDLMSMARRRCPRPRVSAVGRGYDFHHATDEVFHQAPTFVAANRKVLVALTEQGVLRGPARAAAHMGTEMLIDSVLAADDALVTAYAEGLSIATDSQALDGLPEDVFAPLGDMARHLIERGRAVHAVSVERLEFRIGRSLAGRRLLEPTNAELRVIAETLAAFAGEIEASLPALELELRPLWSGAVDNGTRAMFGSPP